MTEGTQEDINVKVEREKFLEYLKNRVDVAFTNRNKVKMTRNKITDIGSSIAAGKRGKVLSELHGNRKINLIGYEEDDTNQVSIENSHDYKDLLKLAFEKIKIEPWRINSEIEKTLEHEYQHHVPGLGEKGLNLRYSVSFFEDEDTGNLYVKPSIVATGSTRAGVMSRIIKAPGQKSRTDYLTIKNVAIRRKS